MREAVVKGAEVVGECGKVEGGFAVDGGERAELGQGQDFTVGAHMMADKPDDGGDGVEDQVGTGRRGVGFTCRGQ